MAKIKSGDWVSLVLEVTDPEGAVLELYLSDEPLLYLHGRGQMRGDVEARLEGQRIGFRTRFEVPRRPWPVSGPVTLARSEWVTDSVLEPGVLVGVSDDPAEDA